MKPKWLLLPRITAHMVAHKHMHVKKNRVTPIRLHSALLLQLHMNKPDVLPTCISSFTPENKRGQRSRTDHTVKKTQGEDEKRGVVD